jgi:homoserine acetyltransferase
MKVAYSIYLLILLCSFCSNSQAEDANVEKTLNKYFDAVKDYDVAKMSELMHPFALERFREVFDKAFHGSKKEEAIQNLLPLFGVEDLSKFEAMNNIEAFERMNKFVARSSPDLIEMLKQSKVSIVTSSIKDDTAYVVYELSLSVGEKSVTQEVVQKLRKSNDEWLLLLPATAEATIVNINAEYN